MANEPIRATVDLIVKILKQKPTLIIGSGPTDIASQNRRLQLLKDATIHPLPDNYQEATDLFLKKEGKYRFREVISTEISNLNDFNKLVKTTGINGPFHASKLPLRPAMNILDESVIPPRNGLLLAFFSKGEFALSYYPRYRIWIFVLKENIDIRNDAELVDQLWFEDLEEQEAMLKAAAQKMAVFPSEPPEPFWISEIQIKNILPFSDLSLSLKPADSLANLAFVLGDNSAGKTAFLRALAAGLTKQLDTPLKKRYRQWHSLGSEEGTIEITIESSADRYRWITRFYEKDQQNEIEKEYFRASDSGWEEISARETPHLFVCGYGAGRGVGVESNADEDLSIASLFLYNHRLRSPETSLTRLIRAISEGATPDDQPRIERETLERVSALIGNLFLWDDQTTLVLTGKGLEVQNATGRQPLDAHGDGYMNTAAWVFDLIARSIQVHGPAGLTQLKGIVLIDEIEQHLHPRWQREIIQKLTRLFPGLQFILTSHSPLCAAGAAARPEGSSVLIKMEQATSGETTLLPLDNLRGLRYDQILLEPAFGLTSLRDPETEAKQDRLTDLFLKEERTPEEEAIYQGLKEELEALPLPQDMNFVKCFDGLMNKLKTQSAGNDPDR